MADLFANLQSLFAGDRFLAALDCDAIDDLLDARDSDPFDANWVRVDEAITRHDLPEDTFVDTLRESAFKRAYAITRHLGHLVSESLRI